MHLAAVLQVPRYSLNSDLPKNPSPQRVIQICDQSLLGHGFSRELSEETTQRRCVRQPIRKSRDEFGFDIETFPQRGHHIQPLSAENAHLVTLGDLRTDRLHNGIEANLQ